MNRSARLSLAFLGLFGLLSAACGKTAPPAPPAYAGPLTSERVAKARDLSETLSDTTWAASLQQLEAVVGTPTKSSATAATWAVVDKDTCTSVEIEKSAKRDAIGGRRYQPLIKKADFTDEPESNYAICVKKASK